MKIIQWSVVAALCLSGWAQAAQYNNVGYNLLCSETGCEVDDERKGDVDNKAEEEKLNQLREKYSKVDFTKVNDIDLMGAYLDAVASFSEYAGKLGQQPTTEQEKAKYAELAKTLEKAAKALFLHACPELKRVGLVTVDDPEKLQLVLVPFANENRVGLAVGVRENGQFTFAWQIVAVQQEDGTAKIASTVGSVRQKLSK